MPKGLVAMMPITNPRQPFVPQVPIPHPEDLSVWGLFAALRTNALTMWPQQAYEEGILRRQMLGRPRFLLNDATAIRRVLVDNFSNYTRTPASVRILRPIIGDGVLLAGGETWRRQRHALAPAFTPRTLPMLARHVGLASRSALDRLETMANSGSVDLLNFMQLLALDIAGRSMFSLEMNRFGPSMRRMLFRYNRHLGRPYPSDLLLPLSVPTLWDFLRWNFRRNWMRFIDEVIAERRRIDRSGEARDLFDLMDAANDPETGAGFTATELRDQVATLIMAGHETTALTMFWACWLLAQDRETQDRVATEAAAVEITPDTAHDALGRLPYTRAVVSETLRLYPPAFTIVRMAIRSDDLGPVAVSGGSIIIISPWVLHRHRRLWSKPEAFDPSRFLPGAPQPDRFTYLPFGAGPRVCIGAQFALTEAILVLAQLIHRFRISLPLTARPALPVAVVTTQPDHAPAFNIAQR